ncbi:hypothetical protein CRG98_016611 [Punica granatum]|nr:hypothetical protein CRG98_016611 [Punica granatum]
MTRKTLSGAFRTVKNPNPRSKIASNPSASSQSPVRLSASSASTSRRVSDPRSRTWSVYLILSTNDPIKTYVGVTTDFTRRLKQHNGELKGGAKASSAGRPWVCACVIHGFKDQSEACSFETKWKSLSKKLPRKRATDDAAKPEDARSLLLLRHREAALDQVKGEIDCSHLEIDWQLSPL